MGATHSHVVAPIRFIGNPVNTESPLSSRQRLSFNQNTFIFVALVSGYNAALLRALLTEQTTMFDGNDDVKPMVGRFRAREHRCEINAGAGIIAGLGPEARRILGPATQKVAIISNPTVAPLFGR